MCRPPNPSPGRLDQVRTRPFCGSLMLPTPISPANRRASPTTSPSRQSRPPPHFASSSRATPRLSLLMKVVDNPSPSPFSRCQSRSCSRWRWIRFCAPRVESVIGVDTSAIPSTRIRLTRRPHPFKSHGKCRRESAFSGLIHEASQGRRRLRLYPACAREVCGRDLDSTTLSILRKLNRRPHPVAIAIAAHQLP